MNFGFDFGWPHYVGSVIGILASLITLAGTVAGGVLLVRRMILAWRNWGQPVVLGPFASRAALLNESIQVVGLREGKRVGRVVDVILDLQTGRVAGFRARAHWRKRLLPFARIKSIGRDAITVESAADLQLPAALPELAVLAGTKYRWEQCEVVTEGGLRLGTTSWRHLWYHRTDGSVELAIESSHQSLINTLLAWAIELTSMFQPLGAWIVRPGQLAARVPLRTVRSASRRMIILSAEGETQFQEAAQAQARQTRETINSSYGKLKDLMSWRERRSSRPPSEP